MKNKQEKVLYLDNVQQNLTVTDNIRRIFPYPVRLSFYSAIILGILTHMYMIVNTLPNHDGVMTTFRDLNATTSGRWFLQMSCLPSSYFSLPWVNGVLAIFYLALTSAVIAHLFGIKNKIEIILTSAILVTFPSIATTFSYLFTADGYMLGLLLATLAAWFVTQTKYGVLWGGICLACSLGIYQAYISFTILLCVFVVIIKLLQKGSENKEILKLLGRFLAVGLLGAILYIVILNICLTAQQVSLTSYQGIADINSLTISTVLQGMGAAYMDFFKFLFKHISVTGQTGFLAVILLSFAFLVFLILALLIKNKGYRSFLKTGVLMLFALAAPLYINYAYMISLEASYHMLMRMTWSLFFVMILVISDLFIRNNPRFALNKWIRYTAVGLVAVIAYGYFLISNIGYFNMQQRYEKAYGSMLRIVDRIEQVDGYTLDTKILLIDAGGIKEAQTSYVNYNALIGMNGDAQALVGHPIRFAAFAQNYLGKQFILAEPEDLQRVEASPEYQQMTTWPDKNSISMIEGIIVARF